MGQRQVQIAVIGGGNDADRDGEIGSLAFEVGRSLAREGAVLLCGGRCGVMERAAAGARSEGGRTVGILPGTDAAESPPNDHIETSVYTGLGQARNLVLVLSSSAVIAVGGGWGTLSEIAMALKHGRPVIGLKSWSLQRPDGQPEPLLRAAESAEEAVSLALHSASAPA